MTATLLVENALVVPCDGRTQPFEGWVEVTGKRISAVGAGAAATPLASVRRIDASGCAVLPGLVNTHAHSHSSLTRGTAEGKALEAWIAAIEREQSRLSDEDAYAAAMATYAEALMNGTTTILDMCLRPEAAMRAARDIGIRVVVAPYVLDRGPFAPKLPDVQALLERHGPRQGRVHIWVGIHDLEGCADSTIAAGGRLAQAFDTGLHLHCAESSAATERTRQRTGRSPIAQLEVLDALGPGTVLAHCVQAGEDDIALLARTGTSVAHCPHANLKLASGFAPIAAMAQAGVRVTLATDGAKANNRLDPFDVMKFASLLPKGTRRDPTVLPAPAVLRMATAAGAEALRLESGAIAVGQLADLTLVDLERLHLQPATPETVETNLVHAARGSDVRMVIVDGEVVVDGGRPCKADAAALLASMKAAARRLMAP
jgi:5-methylthioadenosine/S-adenosylhomocysteine deaminase